MKGLFSGTAYGTTGISTKPFALLPVLNNPPGSYPAGDYPKSVQVTSTPGATIFITTDGSNPTPGHYNVTFTSPGVIANVTGGTTLKAIASKAGYNESLIKSGLYSITGVDTVLTPEFSPRGGAYPDGTYPKSISVWSRTLNPTLHYTLDGSIPTVASPTVANYGHVSVSVNQTLSVIAMATGLNNSAVAVMAYSAVSLDIPTFSPNGGPYSATGPSITISTTPGERCNISYLYGNPPGIPSSTVGNMIRGSSGVATGVGDGYFNAMAYGTGYNDTAVSSSEQFIKPADPMDPGIPPLTI
jgi:beta-glucosidase